MKANDQIPEDEMLLAEAIAAAKAQNLAWCSGRPFKSDPTTYGGPEVDANITALVGSGEIKACCAMGALALAGRITFKQAYYDNGGTRPTDRLVDVYRGNDQPESFHWDGDTDHGESLGWAFRCFMTQDDE